MALESIPVEAITMKTVAEIVNWTKKARPLVTNATIRRDLTALSSLLRATILWTWRYDNPAKQFDRGNIKERRDPIMLPPEHHLHAYLQGRTKMWSAAVRFLHATGMRESEGFYLERSELAPGLSGAQLTETKTNRPRFVPFNREAATILADIPRHITSPFVFWHGDGSSYRNVASRHARIRSSSAVTRMAGEPVTFCLHHLRHSYAVRYLRDGGSIYDLQKILGHESIKTTEVYLKYLSPEQQKIAQRIVPVAS